MTLASLLQYINETSYLHVLAIEDPIEFVYRDLKATVTQREVGSDTPSLEAKSHAGLRQDPDVIMIGELRDYRTIQAALTAAETGHLVMSTLPHERFQKHDSTNHGRFRQTRRIRCAFNWLPRSSASSRNSCLFAPMEQGGFRPVK